MARKLRVEYPGAIYHVMNRGDHREAIYRDDTDRQRFLGTLAEGCVKTGWHIHAFCLMGNPFHLVVETPQGNLVAGMKWFLGVYTSRFNRRPRLSQDGEHGHARAFDTPAVSARTNRRARSTANPTLEIIWQYH